jgi:hypothetical protein
MSVAICPDLESVLMHESQVTTSTWHAGIETGKSIELITLCSLIASFRRAGYEVKFPKLFNEKPDLFYVRNVIPRHHGAQAGHDVAIFNEIPLLDRFLGALTPKAIVYHPSGKQFLIFREGHPMHLISWLAAGKPEYLDRPDILVAEGSMSLKILEDDIIYFKFESSTGTCNGKMRVKNDINLPLIELSISGESGMPVAAIIECSVGKGKATAEEQLTRYVALFGFSMSPITALINGKKKACPAYDFEVKIDVSEGAEEKLSQQLSEGLDRLALGFYGTTTRI